MAEGICSVCNRSMYYSSSGLYECRNFDCPPGTQARHERSWNLTAQLRPKLLKQAASNFSVEEIGLILDPDSGEDAGPELLKLAKRVGLK